MQKECYKICSSLLPPALQQEFPFTHIALVTGTKYLNYTRVFYNSLRNEALNICFEQCCIIAVQERALLPRECYTGLLLPRTQRFQEEVQLCGSVSMHPNLFPISCGCFQNYHKKSLVSKTSTYQLAC